MSWSNQCLICLITKLISVALLQFITHVLVSDKYSNKKKTKKLTYGIELDFNFGI